MLGSSVWRPPIARLFSLGAASGVQVQKVLVLNRRMVVDMARPGAEGTREHPAENGKKRVCRYKIGYLGDPTMVTPKHFNLFSEKVNFIQICR